MYLLSGLARSSLRSASKPLLAPPLRCFARYCSSTMAGGDKAPGGAEGNKKSSKDDGMRELRILMLHGYTQSGPLFRSKTRALENLLAKSLAPAHLKPTLLYPTAPNPLSAKDIPGYAPRSPSATANDDEESTDAWAWFRKDEATATYRLLPEGMHHLAAYVAEHAPIDGVVGFSQGGFVAATIAAVLEPARTPAAADAGWVSALRGANGGRPLKFAVVYSGFFAPQRELAWLYADGGVRTPTLHYLGSLDTVVDEGRSRGLVERCQEPSVVVHPGGHFVPVAREWVGPLVGFVRAHAGEEVEEEGGAVEA